MMEHQTQEYLIHAKVQAMIRDGSRKTTIDIKASIPFKKFEHTLMKVSQVGYNAIEEGVKVMISNMVGVVVIDIIQQGKARLLLLRDIAALTKYKLFVDALTQWVISYQLLIKPVTRHEMGYMDKIEREHCLACKSQ